MMNTEENLEPVWDIFARLEKTEKASKELKKRTKELQREVKEVKDVKPTLEQLLGLLGRIVNLLEDMSTRIADADILATEANFLGFVALSRFRPDKVRTVKDYMVGSLKKRKLSAKKLAEIEQFFLDICGEIEEKWSE
jgi:hypothetical protein